MVIPTARRETRLAFALEALASQTLAPERFEVVVVRADDPGPTTRRAGRAERDGSCPRRPVPAQRRAGTSDGAPRPRRWSPSPTTTAGRRPTGSSACVDAAGEDGERVLQGRTEPDPDECVRLHGLATTQTIVGPTPWYQTCNIAYPRALLERLGGFDERFDGGEDADLGLRAVEGGATRMRSWTTRASGTPCTPATSGMRSGTTDVGTRSRSSSRSTRHSGRRSSWGSSGARDTRACCWPWPASSSRAGIRCSAPRRPRPTCAGT